MNVSWCDVVGEKKLWRLLEGLVRALRHITIVYLTTTISGMPCLMQSQIYRYFLAGKDRVLLHARRDSDVISKESCLCSFVRLFVS